MKKELMVILVFLVPTLLLFGCQPQPEGPKENLTTLMERHGATLLVSPNEKESIQSFIDELTTYKETIKKDEFEKDLTTYRITLAEADWLHVEGFKHGRRSTTEFGFGCGAMPPIVINSSKVRNESAQKGFDAVQQLIGIITNHEDKAKEYGLSLSDAINLNTKFEAIKRQAEKDYNLITRLCIDKEELTPRGENDAAET